MAKQIKLGFDKIPTPFTETYARLLDISGSELKDSDGKPLYTEVTVPVSSYGNASTSTSVVINNEPGKNSIPIIEQFQETSQVSSSLLGVPRAETQLSLFADVSTYGLDVNSWEFFGYNGGPGFQPSEWTTRRNKNFGNRYSQRLEEVSNEQALAITAFPVPWSYPFGKNFEDVSNLYRADDFQQYDNFIKLGNYYYSLYVERNREDFAKQHFLDPAYATSGDEEGSVIYKTEDENGDPLYTLEDIFAEIEKWTITWIKIKAGSFNDLDGSKIEFPRENDTADIASVKLDSSTTKPGYFDTISYYGHLESKRAYRYQPGRVSGFTFGVRAKADPGNEDSVIEWGCGNETDEYMFQLRGSRFSIVRRSVLRLEDAVVERMGLDPSAQIEVAPLNPLRSATLKQDEGDFTGNDILYELVIPQDNFNGDALTGNGPSGYILTLEEVTMYKIEFSWYGAVGAKFYIYVPAGNGDARWVAVHTWVIENLLNDPVLKDPFLKFKYVLSIKNTSSLKEPVFIYKYGASYYIDGGDEGTVTMHSYASNEVGINKVRNRNLLGLFPKNFIANSRGELTKNRKDIIPQRLTVSSATDAVINLIECEGCPGFGHSYSPSLRNAITGNLGTVVIPKVGATAGTRVVFTPPVAPIGSITVSGLVATVNTTFSGVINGSGTEFEITGLSSVSRIPEGAILTRISGSGAFGGTATVTSVNLETGVVNVSTTSTSTSGTIVFRLPESLHGFRAGQKVYIDGMFVSSGENPYNGAFIVRSVPSSTTFTYLLDFTPEDTTPTADADVVEGPRARRILDLPIGTYKKLIGDGIYSAYVYRDEEDEWPADTDEITDYTMRIARRTASSRLNNNINKLANYSATQRVVIAGREVIVENFEFKNVRITGYDNHNLIASTVPLTKENIRINFLNPFTSDSGHSAEFFIGVTNQTPSLSDSNDEGKQYLEFGRGSIKRQLVLDGSFNIVSGEYAQYAATKNANGFDNGESDPRYGNVFQLDPRIANPRGVDSGACSQIKVTTQDRPFGGVQYRTEIDGTTGNFLDFGTSNSLDAIPDKLGGEIGILDVTGKFVGSGVFFAENDLRQTNTIPVRYYIPIEGSDVDIPGVMTGKTTIGVKLVRLEGRFIDVQRVFNFDVYPLYVVIGMKDNSRVNNITLEEFDQSGRFTYTPEWLRDTDSTITIVNSGRPAKVISALAGFVTATASPMIISDLPNTNGLTPGMALTRTSGTGRLGSNAVILSIDSPTQITVTTSTANIVGDIVFNATDTQAEGFNSTNGLYESGGLSSEGVSPANFVENYRLDSGQVDKQLLQPLRPGELRASFYIGANETDEFKLTHIYGTDRYTLSPGLLNTKATFITGKSLNSESSQDIQVNLITKEQ